MNNTRPLSSRPTKSATWSDASSRASAREAIARVHFRFPLADLDISDSGEVSRDSSGPITPAHSLPPLLDEDLTMSTETSRGMTRSVEDVACWVKGVASEAYESEGSSSASVTDEEGIDWVHIEEGILKMVDADAVEVLEMEVRKENVTNANQRKVRQDIASSVREIGTHGERSQSSIDMSALETEKPVPEDFNASAQPFAGLFFENDDEEDNKENIAPRELW